MPLQWELCLSASVQYNRAVKNLLMPLLGNANGNDPHPLMLYTLGTHLSRNSFHTNEIHTFFQQALKPWYIYVKSALPVNTTQTENRHLIVASIMHTTTHYKFCLNSQTI